MVLGTIPSINITISTRLLYSPSFKTLKFGFNCKKRKLNILRFMSEQSESATSSTAESTPPPWLIVGLGNRGFVFKGTRHNVGFEMVDRIANAEGISLSGGSFKSLLGQGDFGLSCTRMFLVGAIVSFYKIPLKQVLLIYDDLDLPFAKLRLLSKGGHGGHNGMKSVIHHFGGRREFHRLRIGIGRPSGMIEAFNYVLRAFSDQESEELEFTFQKGVEAVRILLSEGFDKSATFANSAKPLDHIG